MNYNIKKKYDWFRVFQSKFFCGFLTAIALLGIIHYLFYQAQKQSFNEGYRLGQIDYASGTRCVKLSKNQRGEVIYIVLDSCTTKVDTLTKNEKR